MRLSTYMTTLAFSASALAVSAAAAFAQTQLPGIVVDRPQERTVSGATLERQPVTAINPQVDAPPPRRAQPTVRAPSGPAGGAAPAIDSVAPSGGDVTPRGGDGGDIPTQAGFAIETIGTAVAVVTASDLRDRQIRYTADALRSLPGVQVNGQGGPGTLTQVRIRGAEGRHTRVIIDGVELNTTKDGEFDFSNLLSDDIARIEVIRGPMSGLYGSGALGGVINIVTRRPQGPLSLMLRSEIGSFGTRELAVRLEGGNEQAYVSVGGQLRSVRGFNISPVGNEADGSRLGSFQFKAGAVFAPNARLDVVLRLTEKRAQYDDFGSGAGLPFQTAIDADFSTRTHSVLGGVTLAWDSLNGKLTQEIKFGHTSQTDNNRFLPFSGFFAGVLNTSRDDSRRSTLGYAATYRLDTPTLPGRHALTGRIEGEREAYKPFSDYGSLGFDGDGIERTRDRLSYAGEFRSSFANGLSTTLGLRHDDNNSFRDFTTWRAALAWNIGTTGLRPHASLGTGVKLPGMLDQFGLATNFFIPNAGLRPETSFGYDAGLAWTTLGGRLVLDATYFNATLEDRIRAIYGFDPTTFATTFMPVNVVGQSTRRGVELSARYQLLPTLALGAAYSYTDARDPQGLRDVRKAPHTGRVDLTSTFAGGRGSTTLAAIYNGTRPDLGFTDTFPFFARTTLDAAWLVTAAASYKLTDSVELYGRVENAFNARYQEAFGYQTGGVAAYAGVRVTFDDIAGVKKK